MVAPQIRWESSSYLLEHETLLGLWAEFGNLVMLSRAEPKFSFASDGLSRGSKLQLDDYSLI